jgi:hypothetical protein
MLFNPDGPALTILAATPVTVANHLMTWTPAHPEWDVLRIRSKKSPDDPHFFDELAAAMQFPYHFGENWDAVWDCITDLNWPKAPASSSSSTPRSIYCQNRTADSSFS